MFFPGGTQPSWKITEIPGGALHVGEGGGGGGMDIFWNYTIYLFETN